MLITHKAPLSSIYNLDDDTLLHIIDLYRPVLTYDGEDGEDHMLEGNLEGKGLKGGVRERW